MRPMLLGAVPLLTGPVCAYALLVAFWGGWGGIHAAESLSAPLMSFGLPDDGAWVVSAADLLLALSLVVAFLDMMRASRDHRAAILNQALGVGLLVACLTAMLMARAFDTSTFLLISLMVLLDVVAAVLVALGHARGDGPSWRD